MRCRMYDKTLLIIAVSMTIGNDDYKVAEKVTTTIVDIGD
jgi:hypothetical protein